MQLEGHYPLIRIVKCGRREVGKCVVFGKEPLNFFHSVESATHSSFSPFSWLCSHSPLMINSDGLDVEDEKGKCVMDDF